MIAGAELASVFLRYMNGIQRCEAQLSSLDDAWEHIKRLAEVTCPEEAKTILPSMEKTQSEFKDLQRRLIENLVMENFRKASLELASKAQVAVDILIRNLFERTADVGFLATDDDIRSFLAEPSPSPESVEAIRRRLQDYVAKYTVYEEIVLLDSQGQVKANLDPANPISGKLSGDPAVAQALASDTPYTETFGHSALQPGRTQSLIYSKRVCLAGDEASPLGVLCLCFKFEDELKGIFKSLRKEGEKCSLFILDAAGTAIASSDSRFIPPGSEMELSEGEDLKAVDISGREYLACTRRAKGYQGYCGLGWMGHALIPCDAAFKSEQAKGVDPASSSCLGSAGLSGSLSDIVGRADLINLGLRRVVWNGQVMAGGADGSSKLKPVLSQISKTGSKTISLFSDSIRDLRSTIASSSLSDAKAHARLAIDIMDRNLYERSDDCRWWALNPEFRRILSQDSVSDDDIASITRILSCINGLYTVYSGLFLYDRQGKVLAVSNESLSQALGRKLDDEFVRRTLQVNESQRYTVSSFSKSPLYGGRHTYIYGAPVIEPSGGRRTVGGIGIVFDSEPQFEAMLLDALPSKDGGCGVFAGRDGLVISSTIPALKPGSKLDLDPDFFKLPNGEGLSRIVEFGGKLCIAGCMCSSGYREYKCSGDYKNDVLAFIFVELGDAKDAKGSALSRQAALSFEEPSRNGSGARKSGKTVELASFFIGGRRMAFEKERVVESVSCDRISGYLPGAADYLEGTLTYRDEIAPVINMRVVCGLPKKPADIYSQIVILRLSHGEFMGALVDDLDAVPEHPAELVQPVPAIVAGDSGYVCKIVKSHDGSNEMTLVLDPDLLLKAARQGAHPSGQPLPGASKRAVVNAWTSRAPSLAPAKD